MSTPNETISAVTIANYTKGAWKNFLRNTPEWKAFEKYGKMRKGLSGTRAEWAVEAGWFVPKTVADYADINAEFVPRNRHVRATLEWGEIMVANAQSRGAMLKNSGPEALVDLKNDIIPAMVRSLFDAGTYNVSGDGGLGAQFLNMDATAYTGAGSPMSGLPTIFDTTTAANTPAADALGRSATTDLSTGATIAVGDKFGCVNRSYGGYNMLPNSLSGVVNKAEVNAWSPLLINAGSTGFGTSGAAGAGWAANAFKILTESISKLTFSSTGPEGRPTLGLLSRTLFDQVRILIQAKQNIYIQNAVKASDVFGIGNSVETVNHDGLPLFWSANMPAGVGYLLNMSQVMMDTLKTPSDQGSGTFPGVSLGNDDMFDVMKENNAGRRGHVISITYRGQFKINPKYQGKIFDYKYN